MAAPNPVTDPLYAYDTFGWTNQQNGDIPTVGGSQGVVAPYDAELSGFLASTMDSGVVTTDALLPATNVFYGSLIYIGGPSRSTKFFSSPSTVGTATHAYVALLSATGTTVAASADLTALASGAGSWATAPLLTAGYYYLGVVATWSVQPKFTGLPVLAVTSGNAAGLVYSAANQVFPKYVTSTAAITITSSFPSSVALVAQTTLGTPFVAAI